MFVGDGLVTVSRSWAWTVTAASPDIQAPTLAITSHTPGQTLTAAGITLSGTATDSGRGGSGITSVKVNGVVIAGATASGSNSASWSRAITLVSGANTITVEATDGANNVSMQQLTLNLNAAIAPVTGATLTPNVASPKDTGTAITFTAAGSGGVAPRQYKFLVAQGGGAAQTVQNWSTTATYTWTPTTAASYTISVWVRSAGVSVDAAQASAQVPYTINTAPIAPVTAATITSNLSSPRNTGIPITFTAAGSGGVAPRQYKFLVAPGGGAAQMVRDWSTTATYTWAPTTAASYVVSVWVRSAGVTTDVAQASAQMSYTIDAPPVTSAALSASLASPQSSGTAIAFTASASGGAAPREYKFLVAQGGGAAQTVQNWSTTGTYSWTPTTAATYTVSVWARSAGATADMPQASAQMSYTATAPVGAVTAISATPSTGSGLSQTFTLRYADSVDASELSRTWVWFSANSASNSSNSCLLFYDRPSGKLNLLNSDGTAWLPGGLGKNAALQNAHCSVALGGSSVSLSGTTLTLNLAMTFSASYAGAKNVYLFGANIAGVNTGWQDRGDWIIPAPASAPPPPPPVVTPGGTVTAVSVTPSSGSGSAQTFALQYAESGGATNLNMAWVWFNATSATSSANSCLAKYDRASGTLSLLNDSASAWMPGTVGTSGTLQNGQCGVALSASSASVSGTTLTLNLAMTFTGGYAGAKNVYLFADNLAGANSSWQDRGDWTVSTTTAPPPPPPPSGGGITADSVTPSSGSGTTQSFRLQYSNAAGGTGTGFATAWVWFVDSFRTNSANSCLLYYDRPAGQLKLLNDAGGMWNAGSLGSGGSLQNSQCSVALGGSSVSLSGATLTLTLAMTFSPSYAGTKNVYLFGANKSGVNTGWQDRGDWTVPVSTTPAPAGVSAISATPSSGSGAARTFTLQYGDSSGAASLKNTWVWFTPTFGTNSANSCLAYYDRPANMIYLLSDAGDAWMPGVLGSGGALANSRCSVALSSSSVSVSGTTLTLNLAMSFSPLYTGSKSIYMFASNASGVNSAWQHRGSWIVP